MSLGIPRVTVLQRIRGVGAESFCNAETLRFRMRHPAMNDRLRAHNPQKSRI